MPAAPTILKRNVTGKLGGLVFDFTTLVIVETSLTQIIVLEVCRMVSLPKDGSD
jgi:hypothetical protein